METTVVRRSNVLIALALIALAVLLRILPHPDNFAPMAAIALFGGAVLPRRYAVATPLAAMIVSDLIIGLHSLVLVTWACYALIALASSQWLRRASVFRGAFVTVSGSVFFFVVTNLAVWAEGRIYTHSLQDLIRCFTLALPFFRNTFLSDIIYTASLFGLYALAGQLPRYLAKASGSTGA